MIASAATVADEVMIRRMKFGFLLAAASLRRQ
jgi:hypothetical protein